MSRNVPETVDECTDKIASIANQLGFMYPDIEKTKLEDIIELAGHAEKLWKEEVSEIKKGLNAVCSEFNK